MSENQYTNYSKVMVDNNGNLFQVRFLYSMKVDFYIISDDIGIDDLVLTSENFKDIESFYFYIHDLLRSEKKS
jgi:hypothetical protein